MLKMQRVYTAATCLLLFVFVSSSHSFGLGKNKFKQELDTEAAFIKLSREVETGGYKLISAEELKALIDTDEDILVIDTMPYEASYKKNHIPGAEQFLFPIPEMQDWDSAETGGKSKEDFVALLGADRDKKIVIYCGFVKCSRSHNGAVWATKLGYTNVYRQPGGIFAWKGADYPVEQVQ